MWSEDKYCLIKIKKMQNAYYVYEKTVENFTVRLDSNDNSHCKDDPPSDEACSVLMKVI